MALRAAGRSRALDAVRRPNFGQQAPGRLPVSVALLQTRQNVGFGAVASSTMAKTRIPLATAASP
jgi:hypothetical protein